jgi:hypothetical protein
MADCHKTTKLYTGHMQCGSNTTQKHPKQTNHFQTLSSNKFHNCYFKNSYKIYLTNYYVEPDQVEQLNP